jgi:hypothetical protein
VLIKIHNISDQPVIIKYMTLGSGQEMPVLDESLLESVDVQTLLAAGEIEVIRDDAHLN